ncbi:hypothetical protein QTN47_05250 [Danxiaibacter flavus]|uniref:DUF4339 domain-containing protein n=1 Tax=Danxiaibacter flavus TaxID=3049108 RepID=A0ABV3ZAL1_9BACT|nr:hypothetical protein QNM32_05250 [Chitinophagaceae bacterium DXS]
MYLLLRNNKESGPFTAEQLAKMGLKPYDLIWEEGRTAAWLYPSEIPALKEFAPVIEEQPFDRFYKKPAAATTKPATAKPKFRISAAWRRIDKDETPAAPAAKEETPSWKEVYSEWQQHTPATSPQPEKPAEKPAPRKQEPVELTTKFEQPLQEIKERYVEHLLTGNKRKNGPTLSVSGKQLMETLLVLGVIALGLWMVFKPEKPENAQAATTTVAPKQTPAEQKTIVADQSAVDEEQTAPQQDEEPQQAPQAVPAEVAKEHAKTPIYINAAENKLRTTAKNPHNGKQVAKTQPKQATVKSLKPAATTSNGIIHQAITKNGAAVKGNDQLYQTASNTVINPSTINSAKQQPVIETPVLPKSNTKTVDELIKVNQSARYPGVVEDVHLSLRNMTTSVLDLVVVDLQYYDKKGFYKKGETLYIKNVPANRDITVKAPDDLNASNITYKVSLVSSEQKGLYVVAD